MPLSTRRSTSGTPYSARDEGQAPAAAAPGTPAAKGVEGRLTATDVEKRFQVDGEDFTALSGVSLDIDPGEFVCVVGPSGCGKSTLLMLFAGLMPPTAGTLAVDGLPIRGPSSSRGVVFQEGGVLPWRTVLRNVTYGLEVQGIGNRASRDEVAHHYIDLVGLSGFANRLPKELSGGMRQRLAIAQSLACDPKVLMLDEPFGALDALTRESMQISLLKIWESDRKTVCFVTHSVDEAVLMADRIVVMGTRPGRIVRQMRVPFPRPRTAEIKKDPDYQNLRQEVWQTIQEFSTKGDRGE